MIDISHGMISYSNGPILVDREITRAVFNEHIGIDPFNSANVCSNSYDITLSDSFGIQIDGGGVIDPRVEEEHFNYEQFDEIEILPFELMLASSVETFRIPNDIVAFLHGRSSWARLGLEIHNAGLLDSGWGGQITLELMNNNKRPIVLRAGDRIGQVTFHVCSECDVPYSEKIKAKYDGQIGATGSKLWRDYK